MTYSKIHPLALAITVGVLSGLSTFFIGVAAQLFYTGKPLVGMMGTMYITYTPSLVNSALGGALVLINVFIGTFIVAWVYNFLVKHINNFKI